MSSTASLLLGVDIGTTATKAAVMSAGGTVEAEASHPATFRSPRAGWAEEDPNEWRGGLRVLVPEVLKKAEVAAGRISAVGVSGMVPTLILLDASGRALRSSIQQNDARAAGEIASLRVRTDAGTILERTASLITQQSTGRKLLWLKAHEPEIARRTGRLMGSYDYIVVRLTGRLSAERTWALGSGLFDLERERLGAIHAPQDIVGSIAAEGARGCGLSEGTPVVAGSADHVASAFSAGLRETGNPLIKLGGAGGILCCVEGPETGRLLFLDYHIMPQEILPNGCMGSSGSLIRWFKEEFARTDDYGGLDAAAGGVPAGWIHHAGFVPRNCRSVENRSRRTRTRRSTEGTVREIDH